MALRPFPIMLMALAGMGVAKLSVDLMSSSEPPLPAGDSLFVSSANAATAATPDPEVPETMPRPVQANVCQTPEEMLDVIQTERRLLDEQKALIAKRQAEVDLATEKTRIEQARLEELKTALEGLLAKVEDAQTDDVRRLVALYSNMKPKDAAAIMNDLDIEVSVMVLGTMDERTAAPILAALNPVRARAISQIILERSKLPGDQRLDNLKL
ncbi:MotE family protein [Pseudooceanicola sp. C21-150M6]|uniref:MotE family protein n=1 Tax=Pseudooceanicola sp. C21-150M6 TaxID=3434355 RepID=UPI003D7F9497